MELIYGGSSTGLMGAVANSVINNGGDAIGILPNFLQRQEVAHLNLTKLEFTNGMHERKARMNALADAFVILPGGLGTLDELFEMLTWKQLGLHAKPIVLLNSGGFFNDLIKFLEAIGLKGFLKTEINDLFYTCKSVKECITFLQKKLTINNCDQLIDK
ncbi:LOG family protein YvdD [compost metagenome]